jgi:hypothetical protein
MDEFPLAGAFPYAISQVAFPAAEPKLNGTGIGLPYWRM